MARNSDVSPYIGKLSRSKLYSKKGLYKREHKAAAPSDKAEAKEETAYYPADDVRKPKASRKSIKPTKLRASITPGTVLILLAGRFRGQSLLLEATSRVDETRRRRRGARRAASRDPRADPHLPPRRQARRLPRSAPLGSPDRHWPVQGQRRCVSGPSPMLFEDSGAVRKAREPVQLQRLTLSPSSLPAPPSCSPGSPRQPGVRHRDLDQG